MKQIVLLLSFLITTHFISAQSGFEKGYLTWTVNHNYLPASLTNCNDGGFLMSLNCGNPSEMVSRIIKTDSLGHICWTNYLSDDPLDSPRYVASSRFSESITGGYYDFGVLDLGFPNGTNPVLYLSKYDANGNLITTYQYDIIASGVSNQSIYQTSTGEFLMSFSLGDRMAAMKVDTSGNILWAKNFPNNYPINYSSNGLSACDHDNNLILVSVDYQNNNLIFVRLDSIGNTACAKELTLNHSIDILSMASTQDNGCILLGNDASTYQRLLIKLDSLGNLVWSRVYNLYERFTHISVFSNGNFLINTNMGSSTNYFSVLDTSGQIIKNGRILGAGLDFFTGCPSPSCTSVAYLGYYCNNYSIGNVLLKSDSLFSFDCYVNPYPDTALASTIMLTPSVTPVYIYSETINMQLKNLGCIRDTVEEVEFCSLSINQKIFEKPAIKIYPSPVSTQENIYLEISNLEGVNTISIYDASGKIIQEMNKGFLINTDTTIEIKASGLTEGVYFIRITDKENQLVGETKFVVN